MKIKNDMTIYKMNQYLPKFGHKLDYEMFSEKLVDLRFIKFMTMTSTINVLHKFHLNLFSYCVNFSNLENEMHHHNEEVGIYLKFIEISLLDTFVVFVLF